MGRHWYAAEHGYGTDFINDIVAVHVFDSASGRDGWVADDPYDGLSHNFVREPMGSRDIRIRPTDDLFYENGLIALYRVGHEWLPACVVMEG